MKTLIRHYLIDTVGLYLITLVFKGIVIENGLSGMLLVGLGLMVTTLLVKPIINILLIPLNLLTFGFFKWISNVVALYIVTLIIPGFKIVGFAFSGLSTKWLDIPSFNLTGPLAFLAFSFVLSLITSVFYWLIK